MLPEILTYTHNSVTLHWSSPSGIASQVILYKHPEDEVWQSITVPPEVTEFTVSNLTPETTYQFKVYQYYALTYQPVIPQVLDNPALMLDGQSGTGTSLLSDLACKINFSVILDIDSTLSRAVIQADAAFAARCTGLNWTTVDNILFTAEQEYEDYTDIISIYVNHGAGGIIYEVAVYDGSEQPLTMNQVAAVSVTHCVSGSGTLEDPLIVLQTEPVILHTSFEESAVRRVEILCSSETRLRLDGDWKWSQRAIGNTFYWVGTKDLDGTPIARYAVELNDAAVTAEIYGIAVFIRSHYVSDNPIILTFDGQEIQHSPQGWYYSSGSTCCTNTDTNEHLYYVERVAVPLEMLDSEIDIDFTARILINTLTNQYNLTAAGQIPYYLPSSL